MPTPASQPDEQRLPSPVPRYSVWPLASVGSMVSEPTEFCSSCSGPTWFHCGSPAVAKSVFQTPPPAAPTQTTQVLAVHDGETAIAVMRLAVWLVAPENAVTPGWVALRFGPYCCHWRPAAPGSPAAASRAASASNATSARCVTSGGITFDG